MTWLPFIGYTVLEERELNKTVEGTKLINTYDVNYAAEKQITRKSKNNSQFKYDNQPRLLLIDSPPTQHIKINDKGYLLDSPQRRDMAQRWV